MTPDHAATVRRLQEQVSNLGRQLAESEEAFRQANAEFFEYRTRLHKLLRRDPIDQSISAIELAQVRMNDLKRLHRDLTDARTAVASMQKQRDEARAALRAYEEDAKVAEFEPVIEAVREWRDCGCAVEDCEHAIRLVHMPLPEKRTP